MSFSTSTPEHNTAAPASRGAASITIPGQSAAHHASPSGDGSQPSSLDKYSGSAASPARKLAARTLLDRDNSRPELRAPHLSPEDAEASSFSDLGTASSPSSYSEAHHRRPEGEELAAEGERDEVGFAEAVRREREQRGDYSPIEGGTPGTPPHPQSPLASTEMMLTDEDLEGVGSGPRYAPAVAQDYLSSSPLRWVPKSSKVQTPPLCSSIKGLDPMTEAQPTSQGAQGSAPVRPSPLAST